MTPQELIEKMRRDWDERARENFRHYIVDSRTDWSSEDFRISGEQTVEGYVLSDMTNACQEKDPSEMRVLDFGCGAGRLTRALAKVFGEVHGVDISPEMVKLAEAELADLPNAHVHLSNGEDLGVLGDLIFDYAFAFSVFHHVPSKDAVEKCIAEVGRHLGPGRLFKFEVQGHLGVELKEGDTWVGVPLSEQDMAEIAERSGFEARHSVGAGEQNYWHWFFRKPGSR
jgi:SAM-dependent methyltransferase